MNKKGDITQIFVYLLSVIIVVFAGFLVTNFVISFFQNVDSRTEAKMYEQIEFDFNSVYKTYGSEKTQTYRLGSKAKYICFAQNGCDTSTLEINSDEMAAIISGGDNIALFEDTGMILSSRKIGDFSVENNCFCAEAENNRVKILFENRRNIVWISEE